jgi:hypothetical protein
MGLFGQYPGTLFRQAGGPAMALMPILADYFRGSRIPAPNSCNRRIWRHRNARPHADGAHLTHSLPLLRGGSIAEQGHKMQIGEELQGLSSQADNPKLMPFRHKSLVKKDKRAEA